VQVAVVAPEWSKNGAMAVALSIKNVPDRLASALQKRAERNHRSLQGELMHILEQAVDERPFDARAFVKRLEKYKLPKTKNESTAWIRRDRDSR
jgi:antitoxin FitA